MRETYVNVWYEAPCFYSSRYQCVGTVGICGCSGCLRIVCQNFKVVDYVLSCDCCTLNGWVVVGSLELIKH